ncbi:MAG TPA: BREX-1 system adenine-specific DNA-methyltransferase PglX, partial [Prevotella sp.]|nr:BREX-1 system adenine-specific DNA-methyltransferase PglX [Prevotella sp.]
MDTNRLKRFAVEARNILMQGVKNRLQAMGFDLKTGKPAELPQKMEGGAVFMGDTVSTDFYCRWMSLYNNICARGIRQVAEEAAYTWFNRFMAIRIMQKQGFISPVLAYESEDVRVPVIVSEARQGRMPQMSDDVRSKLMELLDDDSKTNEQFALLIVAYCHENPIINKCFGNIADYTELLLPQNILAEGGFVSMLNDTAFIKDDDFRSAELIGWLYQFYISDRKAEAFAKKGKYDTDDIAPATQIFTPNWIVKYMVENTVGRIYIDNNPYCEVKDNMKYLVNTPSGGETLKVDDLAQLTVADLACGSGHILNECFDLLYAIYVEEGYSRTQGISHILRRNLLGIDLDTRAKQLATFALLMKACQKDSSFLDGKVMPRVYDMPHPIAEAIAAEGDTRSAEEYLKETLPHYLLGGNTEMVRELTDAILLMNHADTLGSIMKFDISEQTRNAILVRTQEYEKQLANGDIVPSAIQLLMPYMRIILALTEKYTALVMNPPYMGSGHFDSVLSKYVKDNYAEGKSDLFSVFMQMGMERLADGGKMAQINMQSWMFLSSFEKLRNIFLHNYIIDSMLHLGPRTFDELSGEVVQNTAFVLTKPHDPYGGITLGEVKTLPEAEKAEWKRRFMEDVDKDLSDWLVDGAKGTYYRLVDGKNCAEKEQLFLSHIHGNEDGNRVYYP